MNRKAIDNDHQKIHTLFIPFVIWNVTGALCLLPFDKKPLARIYSR